MNDSKRSIRLIKVIVLYIVFICLLGSSWGLLAGHLNTWQDGVEDTEDHGSQVTQLQTDAVELRDAQPHKHIVGIEQAT